MSVGRVSLQFAFGKVHKLCVGFYFLAVAQQEILIEYKKILRSNTGGPNLCDCQKDRVRNSVSKAIFIE